MKERSNRGGDANRRSAPDGEYSFGLASASSSFLPAEIRISHSSLWLLASSPGSGREFLFEAAAVAFGIQRLHDRGRVMGSVGDKILPFL